MVKSKPSMTATINREAEADTSYWLQHRPGDPEAAADPEEPTAFAWDISGKTQIYPSDMLVNPEYYLEPRSTPGWSETIATLRSIQGKPDAVVTVYRGAPSDDLNVGDWVTLSKSYAEQYAGDAAYSDNPDSRVNAFKVKAGDLTWDGDSWFEFGYWGKRQRAR